MHDLHYITGTLGFVTFKSFYEVIQLVVVLLFVLLSKHSVNVISSPLIKDQSTSNKKKVLSIPVDFFKYFLHQSTFFEHCQTKILHH